MSRRQTVDQIGLGWSISPSCEAASVVLNGLSLPFPLRFPLAFDGKLLGQVVLLFTDSVSCWYHWRHKARGLPDGETGAVTAIQRANSDLRL